MGVTSECRPLSASTVGLDEPGDGAVWLEMALRQAEHRKPSSSTSGSSAPQSVHVSVILTSDERGASALDLDDSEAVPIKASYMIDPAWPKVSLFWLAPAALISAISALTLAQFSLT